MKEDTTLKCLLILGCGYVGTKLAQTCLKHGMQVKATARSDEGMIKLQALGIDAKQTGEPNTLDSLWLQGCDAVLDSIPLSYHEDKTPFQTQQQWVTPLLAKMPNLTWVGYLSATSVYADSAGEWIHEDTPTQPTNQRGLERLSAEQVWLNSAAPAEIFRLSGIYGNERNLLSKLFAGAYKTVDWQPEHYSNRIHVDDIVNALMAAMQNPKPRRILNLTDDEPCSHAEYTKALARLIDAPAPIVLTPEQATLQMSSAYLDFFRDNKRISNQKLHQELLPHLKYPSFRDAVAALGRASLLNKYGRKS